MGVIDGTTRFRILERDRFTCRYCGRRAPHVELEVDHVHPRSKDGKDDDANLVAACFDCNRAKRDRIVALPGHWDSLEGKFFHDLTTGGGRQGIVLGLAHGHLVVQFFSWLHGGPAWGTNLVSLDAVVNGDWQFYSSMEAMQEAYEYGGVAERMKRMSEASS